MSKERLEGLADLFEDISNDMMPPYVGITCDTVVDVKWVLKYAKEQAERVQDQQATIESLSMAHDAIHREMPKDKHTLIKNIIGLNGKVQELEETNKKNYWIAADFKFENLKLEQQNKRYRELLESLRYTQDIAKEIRKENPNIKVITPDDLLQHMLRKINEELEEAK